MKLTPSFTPRFSTRFASSTSLGSPQIPLPVSRIAPNPRRFTSRSPPILNVFAGVLMFYALLRFFEQFGSVLRSHFNYFLDERCFLRGIDLGRRSGTGRNRCSHLF